MFLNILLIIIIAWLLFEFVEHAVVPLVWLVFKKNRQVKTGPEGMVGEVGVIKVWDSTEGKIFVHGELWQAEGEDPFAPGDKAVVLSVEGLTLIVGPQQKP
jgi:membrane-bound serine protease (ClpP class)